MIRVEGIPISDEEKRVIILTREFHGVKLYAFTPITLKDLLMLFMGSQMPIDVICKERVRRMGLFVRPENENNEVIEPNFAYTYPYEIFFTDGETVFRSRRGRGIVDFTGYTYVAKYDYRNNGSMIVWMDQKRKQVNTYLDRINVREDANISVV